MYKRYGDVVLLGGTGWLEDNVIGWLTDCKYHHSGILTSRDTMDVMTRTGVRSIHFDDLEKEAYDDYVILEHREMNLKLRRKMKRINEKMFRDKEYDEENIKRLRNKLLIGKLTRGLSGKFNDEDISGGGLYCHSRIWEVYNELGVPMPKIHPSQMIAPHFLESKLLFNPVIYGNKKGRRHYLH